MLEQSIEKLTDAIERLTARIGSLEANTNVGVGILQTEEVAEPKKAAAKKKVAPVPEPERETQTEPEEDEVDEPTPSPSSELTLDDLRAKLSELAKREDNRAPKAFLKSHGYERLSDVPEDAIETLAAAL